MSSDIQPDRKRIKNFVGFIAGASTSAVAKEIISNNVEKSGMGRLTIPIGTLIIGSMAAKAARDYTDSKLDNFFEALEKAEIISRVDEEPTE